MDHYFVQSGEAGDAQRMGKVDPNHFDGSYFANQTWQLAGLERSEDSYRVAEREYRRAGRRIIDATVGGHWDGWEKGDYQELLGGYS